MAKQEGSTAPDKPVRFEYGEPYDLLGNRLYFQNWFWIRQGKFSWNLPDGRKVGLQDSVSPETALLSRLDQPEGIRLIARKADRVGPLFEAERPWEDGAGVALTTVIRDGGIFRGWGAPFTTSGDPPGQKHFVYFESNDGFAWKRE